MPSDTCSTSDNALRSSKSCCTSALRSRLSPDASDAGELSTALATSASASASRDTGCASVPVPVLRAAADAGSSIVLPLAAAAERASSSLELPSLPLLLLPSSSALASVVWASSCALSDSAMFAAVVARVSKLSSVRAWLLPSGAPVTISPGCASLVPGPLASPLLLPLPLPTAHR